MPVEDLVAQWSPAGAHLVPAPWTMPRPPGWTRFVCFSDLVSWCSSVVPFSWNRTNMVVGFERMNVRGTLDSLQAIWLVWHAGFIYIYIYIFATHEEASLERSSS